MKKSEVIEAIKALEDAHGRLTPDMVVDAARNPDSPLHVCFEWRDDRAAEEFRLDQARRLIVSVRYEVTTNRLTLRVPLYLRDPEAQTHAQGYRAVTRIRDEPQIAHEALVQEMARVGALLKRARHLAMVLNMADQVAALEAQVAGFMADLEPPVEAEPEPAPPPRRRGRWRKGGREARV